MAYARLDVRKGAFLAEGLVCTYAEAGAAGPLTGAGSQEALAGSIFRAQTGSEAGKGLRWFSEAKVLPTIAGPASRNSLLNTVLLCGAHHSEIHRTGGWAVVMAADGLPSFIPPRHIDPDQRPRRNHHHRHRQPDIAA